MAKIAAVSQLLDKEVTVSPHRPELLSPARDATITREVILYSADAVCIGDPGFDVRHNASNSLKGIAELVPSVYHYDTKIFVTLNTILHDDELEPMQQLITDFYQAGIDVLIVQGMRILELDIPPIELHASTRYNIRTVEKAKLLSDVGLTQIVLAQELNLEQLRAVHRITDAAIKFFIHGALCVAYSGQCYTSHTQIGRNTNRDDCSQARRLPHALKDGQKQVVSYEKRLLSMKGNDRTANLGTLTDAGVHSFKIERRYKDTSYVKNTTARYRQMLGAIIEEHGNLVHASSGRVGHFFVSSTEKTFHRGSMGYFVSTRGDGTSTFDSPKFIGLPVGEVLKVAKGHTDVAVIEPLINGDGLNMMIKREAIGFRTNTIEEAGENQHRIQPSEMSTDLREICLHHPLNHNLDHNWQQALTKTPSERRVAVGVELDGWQEQLILTLTSGESVSIIHALGEQFSEANNAGKVMNNLKNGPAKLGQTVCYARNAWINLPGTLFVPNSLLSQFHRRAADTLNVACLANYQRGSHKPVADPAPVRPQTHLSFLANVYNQKTCEFCHRYGV